jgi:hypothetical protein
VGIAQIDALTFEKNHDRIDADLLLRAQPVPPHFEFAGEEYIGHKLNIACGEYRVKGILGLGGQLGSAGRP